MSEKWRSGSSDTSADEDYSKLCYDNFPHYEGIKKEVKEQLICVITYQDFGTLLTLLIPSTTNILLLLYACNKALGSIVPFSSERTQSRYAESEIAVGYSWSFSSENLFDSGRHGEFASTLKKSWGSLVTPSDTEDIMDDKWKKLPTATFSPTGSAGVIADAVEREATFCDGPPHSLPASYADITAGRRSAMSTETTMSESTDSSPRSNFMLSDFLTPKLKKRPRQRKRSSKQKLSTVEKPAPADDQLSTGSCEQAANEGATDAVRSPESNGSDSTSELQVALQTWSSPSPAPSQFDTSSISSATEESQIESSVPDSSAGLRSELDCLVEVPLEDVSEDGGCCWVALFADKVQQLEEAGKWFAERLAVGELQPDPATIFFDLMYQLPCQRGPLLD